VTWADYVILTIVGFSGVVSVLRGFIREALALAGWVLGLWVAFTYMDPLAGRLAGQITVPSLRAAAAFALLLAGTLMASALVVVLVGALVEKTGISGTDRMLGLLFGVARGVVVVGLLVLGAGLTRLPEDPWWRESVLLPHFETLAEQMRDLLPPDLAGRLRFGPGS